MINLPASYLSTKFTKEELENARLMAIYNKYKYYLEQAKESKSDYLLVKSKIEKGTLDDKNLKAALKLKDIFKADALEYWNKSQEYLAKYNEQNNN